MPLLLNTKSPASDINAVIKAESDKAYYWFKKKMGGDDSLNTLAMNMHQKAHKSKTRYAISTAVEYRGQSLNTWLVFFVSHELSEQYHYKEDSNIFIIYQETDGRCGAILRATKGDTDKEVSFVFSPDFFDKLKIIKPEYFYSSDFAVNLTEFCANNPFFMDTWDDDKNVVMVFKDFFAVGVEEEETKWVISNILVPTEEDKCKYHHLINKYHKLENDWYERKIPTSDNENETLPEDPHQGFNWVYNKFFEEYTLNADYDNLKFVITTFLYDVCADFANEIANKNLTKVYAKYRESGKLSYTVFGQQINKVFNAYTTQPFISTEQFSQTFFKAAAIVLIACDCDRDMSEEEMFNYFKTNRNYQFLEFKFKHQIINNGNIMDKKCQDEVKKILKNYSLKGKFENIVKNISTVEAYLNWVQPIYALSRLINYTKTDKERTNFKNANKDWLAFIINEDKSSAIKPYVDNYGKSAVIQAVNYLIDNNSWESPIGIKGIRKPDSDLYKGLEMINEAVNYLRSENLLVVEEPEVVNDTPETEDVTEETKPIASVSKTKVACKRIKEAFMLMQDNLDTLEKYVESDELCEMLETENKAFEKANQKLTESIKVVNRQLSQANTDINRFKEETYNARKNANEAIQKYENLNMEYKKLSEEYEKLKELAKTTAPTKKIIPLSKFMDLPLVGWGVMKGIIPMLAKYNIVIDESK